MIGGLVGMSLLWVPSTPGRQIEARRYRYLPTWTRRARNIRRNRDSEFLGFFLFSNSKLPRLAR